MTSLFESIPNVSEGRRGDVVQSLADAVEAVGEVRLLDCSSDRAHNRSVLTIAGPGDALADAVLALAERAVATIDLRAHRGEHPRLGAVDVVPFVPLDGATLDEAVALARRVGQAMAERFALPVYLYEAAATTQGRVHLEDIRRGQFEGLADKMSQPGWAPDFGPSTPHTTAGATVVGARPPLIAYNVNLATDRLDVAKKIARLVRQSSGGLPAVKALGISLEERGIVQVSMNLTDYTRTSMRTVFDRIVEAARTEGVKVLESEIIGLIPRAALEGTTPEHLRLRDFSERQILENCLANAGLHVPRGAASPSP